MTDGTRILRTVAVPLIVALVFLFFVPRTCQKLLGTRKLQHPAAAVATVAPADTGLHIQSDRPAGGAVVYPPGLDAQRIEYLIGIDQHFAEPLVLRIPKPGGPPLEDTTAANALVTAGWLQPADGGYTVSPGAALHLEGLTEDEMTLRIPVATRKFERVQSIADTGDGRARVGFTWKWEPNEAGRAINSSLGLHQGTAIFAGGGEHPWDLVTVEVDTTWK